MAGVANPVIGQYFYIADEGSRTWSYKFTDNIPFDKLTRLYIAFAWVNNGQLTYNSTTDSPTDQARIADLVGACRKANPNAEIYISSGYDSDGQMYKDAAKDPDTFAASVVQFLEDNGLDGYDMDWENGIDATAMDALLTAIRKAYGTAGKPYGLTVATWPTPTGRGYDVKALAAAVDAINIMSYGRLESLSGNVSSWSAAGFPIAKMIGGIDTEPGYPGPGGTDTLGSGGTIAQKATYAWQNGLAGMMEWRLDNDYTNNQGYSTYQGAEQLYDSSPVPVYLFTAENPSRFFYSVDPTASPGAGWTPAGVAFYAFMPGVSEGSATVVPVNQHSAGGPQRYSYGTTTTLAPGWTDDALSPFAAFATQVGNTVPVYAYHTILPGGFWNMAYSLDPTLSGWISDGVAFYVYG